MERIKTALSAVLISFLVLAIFTLEYYTVDCKSPGGHIVLKAIQEGMCPEGYEEVKTEESPTKTIQTVDCKDPYGYIFKNIRKGMCPPGYEEIIHEVTTQYPLPPGSKEKVTTFPQKPSKNEIPKQIGKEKPSFEESKKEGIGIWKIVVIALIVFIIYAFLRELGEKEKRIRALQLSDIDNMNGGEFERYVSRLLKHRGFDAEVLGGSGDLGVDIIAQKNNLKYAVQVKRLSEHVSRRAVSDAVAGKSHYHCNAAMVVTNSHFTEGANKLSQSTRCELIDRDTLAEWILDFQNSKDNFS